MNSVLLFSASLLLLGTSGYASPCGCSNQKELPPRIDSECDTTYYKRIFPIDISCGCQEKLKKFYESVFYQYKGETEETYVLRIDTIFDQIHQKHDCRTNYNYVQYLDKYYTCKYGKKKGENDELYFERVLKKCSSECASVYKNKIEIMKRFIKHVDWSKVSIEENTSAGYSIIKKSYKKQKGEDCECSDNHQSHLKNKEQVKSQQLQHAKNVKYIDNRQKEHNSNVEEIEGRKREHARNVEQIENRKREHERNVNIIESRKQEHAENVEKIERQNREHEENVKKWIKANYKRKSGECIDDYYSRICCKDSLSDEEYVERLTMVRSMYSDLELWYSEKYMKLVERYYKLAYKQKCTETDTEYYNRLLCKESYESEEKFINRITILQKLFSSLDVWYDERFYETCTSKLYEHCYEQYENEHEEEYLRRVFTKLCGESEEQFWMRVKLIKKTFPNYSCWYNKEYMYNLSVCSSLRTAESLEDLKNIIYSETISEECRETKIECLKTFFESSSHSLCSCGKDIYVRRL